MNGGAKTIALLILGALVFTSIISITIVAVMTERDVSQAVKLVFGGAVLIALLGGLAVYVDKYKRNDKDTKEDPKL